jgi:hypothetical protein
MVARIVEATNWQNAISSADLRANDRRQIEIERDLSRLGNYFYVRKRQAKSEVRRLAPRHTRIISKEDLMRAVAACRFPNLPLRKGLQKLFEEDYERVFDTSTRTLLSCYWLFNFVGRVAWGSPGRKYAKFIAAYAVWQEVFPSIRRSPKRQDALMALCAAKNSSAETLKLERCVKAAFTATDRFFAAKRGRGEKRVEPSTFFKRKDVHGGFETYWQSEKPALRDAFVARAADLVEVLEAS